MKWLENPSQARKILVLLVILGLAILCLEVRYEHQAILVKHWQGWIPIAYSFAMVVTGLISIFFWNKGGRYVVIIGFLIGVVIGLLGVWFHSEGKLINAVSQVIMVVFSEPGRIIADDGGPPVLAPLSLTGLGTVGVILCMTHFPSKPEKK